MEQVFLLYKDKVYGFILSNVYNEDLAKDLTQEVFLSLCLNKDKVLDMEDINRYVFLTTKNRVIDYFRKAARDRKNHEQFIQIWENACTDMEKRIDEEHMRSILDQTINALPPRQQTVYRMSKFQDLSLKDIAEKLNLSPNTVKNHLVQANNYVRNHISTESIMILLIIGLL